MRKTALGCTILEGHDVADLPLVSENSEILELELAKKVDKATGKGLSTNDYTTAEKNKLKGIATGANNYTHPAGTNPHGTTKADVGLNSVSNYGVATKADAEAGSSNAKYMTPLRTKEAIQKVLEQRQNIKVIQSTHTFILNKGTRLEFSDIDISQVIMTVESSGFVSGQVFLSPLSSSIHYAEVTGHKHVVGPKITTISLEKGSNGKWDTVVYEATGTALSTTLHMIIIGEQK